MDDEHCPKCAAIFPANRAWAKRTVTIFNQALQDLDTRVRCPSCENVFDARAYRFFGFVTPRAMRAGIVTYIALFILAAIYFLFIDDAP
jgi:hypothetical protein